MCCSLTLGNTGFMVSTHLQPDNDIVALLPVPAQDLVVGGDEVAEVKVRPDVQALHGPLQILRKRSLPLKSRAAHLLSAGACNCNAHLHSHGIQQSSNEVERLSSSVTGCPLQCSRQELQAVQSCRDSPGCTPGPRQGPYWRP